MISPDGTKLLFVRLGDFLYDETGRLEVLHLATSGRKLISRDSGGGSWSPDGMRIVHGLNISKADGSGSRRLVAIDGEARLWARAEDLGEHPEAHQKVRVGGALRFDACGHLHTLPLSGCFG